MTRRSLGRAAAGAIGGIVLLLSSTVAFRTGLPASAPASSPAQCSPAGPRVDLPGRPARAPAPPGLLGLPHPRHARAAHKIQVCVRSSAAGALPAAPARMSRSARDSSSFPARPAQALAQTVAKIKQELNRRDMFKVVSKRLLSSATGLATIMATPPVPVRVRVRVQARARLFLRVLHSVLVRGQTCAAHLRRPRPAN